MWHTSQELSHRDRIVLPRGRPQSVFDTLRYTAQGVNGEAQYVLPGRLSQSSSNRLTLGIMFRATLTFETDPHSIDGNSNQPEFDIG